MYILYADDAGNTGTDYENIQQPLFTLTGIIIEADKWNEINEIINKAKIKIIPDYPTCELHATEIYNGQKTKEYNFRQYGLEKNLQILEGFVDLILSLKLQILTFTVKKSNLKSYCQYHYGMAVKIDPYLIAFPYITLFFDNYIIDNKSKGLIILDEQQALVKNIDDVLERLRLVDDKNYIIKINNIIERALFLESFKSNFIQIADICNFYINRYLSMDCGTEPKEPKKSHIINMYNKLKPLIIEPKSNPAELKEMLDFFDDNKEILRKK